MKIKRIALALAAISILLTPFKAISCGPFFDEAIFTYEYHPDFPLRFFANGKLGILSPSFARSYQFCAYREISGKPLTDKEKEALGHLWIDRMTNSYASVDDAGSAVDAWLAERNKLLGIKKLDRISTDRNVSLSNDDVYNSYLNCPGDSFKNALATLKQKIAKSGASSNDVKEWVAAQDQVFSHCSGPDYKYDQKKYDPEPAFPAPAAPNADAATKADRAYQIAAANFYAQKFDQAAKEFDAIAKDESSPYHALAPYLAARCYVRKGTLPKTADMNALQEAKRRLDLLLSDPKTSPQLRENASGLLGYVAIKHFPDSTLKSLAEKLSTPAKDNDFLQNITDYTILLDKFIGSNPDDDAPAPVKLASIPKAAQSELTEWIVLVQSSEPAAAAQALQKWQATKSPLWLVPAIIHAKAGAKESGELLNAALNVPPSSPAYVTCRYYAVKLLIAQNERTRALKVIAEILDAKDQSPSTNNLFIDERARLAASMQEYWTDVVRVTSGSSSDTDGMQVPDELEKIEAKKSWYTGPQAFSPKAANVLNRFVTLSALTTATTGSWPAPLKGDYLQALWTRSILLKDDKVTAQITPQLAAQNSLLTKLLNEYKSLSNADQKQFLSSYILVMNPAMRPYITPGTLRTEKFNKIDDFQDNWWCANSTVTKDTGDPASKAASKPAFLNQQQLAQAAAEDKKLLAAGSGPTYLLTELIAYARKPGAKDKRLPEALYHAVRSPKFACADKTTSALSKTAFQILHKDFPQDPWTAKTKYWY